MMFAFNGDFVLKSLHSRRLILFLILIQISRIVIFITASVVTLSKQKTSDYERVTQKLTQTSNNNFFLRSLVSAFYYPNIKFMYAEGIPDVKSVKQSAYKLQAVLANRRWECWVFAPCQFLCLLFFQFLLFFPFALTKGWRSICELQNLSTVASSHHQLSW